MNAPARYRRFSAFKPIRSRAIAVRVIGDASLIFFVIASLQAVGAAVASPASLVLAVLFAGGAVLLLRLQSRGAALGLLIVSMAMLAVSLLSTSGNAAVTVANIVIAAILVWAAARALEATVKLRGRLGPRQRPTAS